MPTITSLAWSCRQCPPLRSVLLASTSNNANSRKRSSCSSRNVKKCSSGSWSTKRCTAPTPSGPSRSTVSGTMSQPSASESSNAATSRLAERALREVPQRPLAAPRLVDRGELHAVDLRLHEEGRVRRVAHAADDLELGGLERGAQLGGGQFQRGHRCPDGIHRLLAQRARRATAGDGLGAAGRHGPHLRAGRVDARDVALVVFVVDVGRRPRLRRPRRTRSRSSMSTSSRSGSKPSPISRARNSGTVGSRSVLCVCGSVERQLGVVVGDLVEERDRLGRRAARPAPSRRAR